MIMTNINIYLSFYLLIVSLILLVIVFYSTRLKNIAGKNTFILLCTATLIYTFGYAMELNFIKLNTMLFWNFIQYLASPLLPALWLTFALQFTEKDHILNKKTYALIYTIPIITMILRYTNNYHHLLYKNSTVYYNNYFYVLSSERGVWYYVHFVYATLIIIFTSIMYFQLFLKTNSKIRSQALLMFYSSIFPWAAYAIMIFLRFPYHIDFSPFFLSISTLLLLVGFFKYNFLSIIPIARDKVFEWSKDGILILDDDYSVIDYNEKAKEIIISLGSKSIGDNIKQYLNGYTSITSAYKTSQESQFKISKNGTDYYYDVKCLKINDKKNNVLGFMVFLQDITELTNTLIKLNHYASTDSLTGVYNRRSFAKKAEDKILQAKTYKLPLSFMILDLDNFKHINDTYGHLLGDEVVIHVSNVLQNNIKQNYILGRYGGEEFIILMPETNIEEAVDVAEELRQKIEKSPVSYNEQIIRVTASFGVSGVEYVENEDLNTFLKYADKALYLAKQNGRNCVFRNNIN